jgi:hypothetical protein
MRACWPSCGCLLPNCQLGLPPMVDSALSVEEDELPNDHFRLQQWTALELDTVVTEPLVVLTALSTEPLILFPGYRNFPNRNDRDLMLLKYTDWATTGFTNYQIRSDFPNLKYLSLGGLRRLVAAGSWYTSAIPVVRDAVFTHELERDNIPRLATIERRMLLGWDGSFLTPNMDVKGVKLLSWWKTYSQQLRQASYSKRRVFKVLTSAWINCLRHRASPPEGVSFSLWTATQRTRLRSLYPDTLF